MQVEDLQAAVPIPLSVSERGGAKDRSVTEERGGGERRRTGRGADDTGETAVGRVGSGGEAEEGSGTLGVLGVTGEAGVATDEARAGGVARSVTVGRDSAVLLGGRRRVSMRREGGGREKSTYNAVAGGLRSNAVGSVGSSGGEAGVAAVSALAGDADGGTVGGGGGGALDADVVGTATDLGSGEGGLGVEEGRVSGVLTGGALLLDRLGGGSATGDGSGDT